MDERISLPSGYKLTISNSDSNLSLIINDVIGRGGNCLVYKAIKTDHINNKDVESAVILKEFYPEALEIKRLPDMSLKVKKSDIFEKLKEHFGEGQIKHILFYDDNQDRTLPKPFFYGGTNNTVYSVSELGYGSTLSNINTEQLDLNAIY